MSDRGPRRHRILLVPGGGGSDPGHWHHRWAESDDRCEWVTQRNWTDGTRAEWVDTLDRHIGDGDRPAVLVAHSLGVIVVAHWAAGHLGPVVGALLVAPADVEGPWAEPDSLYRRFDPIPMGRLPFPSIVVAGPDDPYLSCDRAAELAEGWGSRLVEVADAGHLGADSDLDRWAEGWALLDQLIG